MTRGPAKRGEGRRGVGLAAWTALAGLVGVALMPNFTTAQYGFDNFSDLQGDYCRARRVSEQCCRGRYDDCAMPILGTLCYCDQFCNRTVDPDCCPDFWDTCGVPKPVEFRSCWKDGSYIRSGRSRKFNCNECKCNDGRLTCEEDPCMVDEEVIRRVNADRQLYGWTAGNYSMFWGRKASEGLLLKTGTLNPELLSMRMYPIFLRPDLSRIPRHFDARRKREWAGQISGVRDQGWCAASWAFSTLGVAQDRLSVESQGNESVILSPQHLLSCDRRGQSGCKGGRVDRAWQYLRRNGVVNDGCYAYVSGDTGKVPMCQIPRGLNLQSLLCVANEAVYKRPDLYRTEPAYRISGKEEDIQWEIMNFGPVQAMMNVQRDLFMYREGVYAASSYTGGDTVTHSVRILGWGEEPSYSGQSTKYWLAANSWGTDWGEDGMFRIRRGFNESGIETFVLAVRARLYDYDKKTRRWGGRRVNRHTQSRNHKYDYHKFYLTKRHH